MLLIIKFPYTIINFNVKLSSQYRFNNTSTNALVLQKRLKGNKKNNT